MFFILSELYLSGMFLMKRDVCRAICPVGKTRAKERILYIVKIGTSLPGNRPCRLPAPLDLSHAFGGGRDEAGSGPLFRPFAAATTTKTGPRNALWGRPLREHGSFWEGTRFLYSTVHKRMHDKGCENLSGIAAPGNFGLPRANLRTCSPRQHWLAGDQMLARPSSLLRP